MTKRIRTTAGILLLVFLAGCAAPASTQQELRTPDPASQPEQTLAAQPAAEGAEQKGAAAGKEEVVYAALDASGGVEEVYVVNYFEGNAGAARTDYGDYTAVLNLTDTAALPFSDGAVSVPSHAENFYYQGTMAVRDLPWVIDIDYVLDGVPKDPAALAGQAGRLEIRIQTARNEAVDPVFYDNYMLQITLTLDGETCANIAGAGATVANAGTDKSITFTALPGSDANLTLSADVRDFEMAGISIAAVPFSMSFELPDTGGMTGQMTTLADAIGSLKDGVKTLTEGTAALRDGADALAAGSGEFAAGMNALSENGALLVAGSDQIRGALSTITAALGLAAGSDISPEQIAGALDSLEALLAGFSGNLNTLRSNLSESNAALSGALGAVPDLPQEQMDAYIAALEKEELDSAPLAALYSSSQAAKSAYFASGGVGESIQHIIASLDTLSTALSAVSTGLTALLENMDADDLLALADGLNQLSAGYETFHAGLVAYTGGVSAAAQAYGGLHAGITGLAGGTGELHTGTETLYRGVDTMHGAVADLPETMEIEIEKLMEDFTGGDFDPVSFASGRNTSVAYVQFVMMTRAVAKEAPAAVATAETGPQTIWERVVGLFTVNR